ncbi:ubiquitin-associated protein 2-like isoform X1 [Lytechinus variegatus]|uniref:ubiquitin-associated protein 2-like isoform X1 n=1 Tax=Lytechinus variegatus TaxID=7654 RepID=UPI001BB205B2|nr:ubiquitin-associated protein 2-like isoform X1 [Lytechinus variegatus]XP_041465447.1 ubiquitin-associated protein 2-like isoform X1 [Lytechinus variegatus]
MMSSMGSSRGNVRSGGRADKSSSQKTSAQNVTAKSTPTDSQQPVGKKATQEQMRMAQMISDPRTEDNDVVKEKVKQVHELTNRSEDEIMVALHDSNYDTEQAIILLLEREEGNQKDEWETISSKKSKVRGMPPSMRNTDSFNNHQDKDHKNDDDRRDRGGRGRNRDNRENRDGHDGRGDRGDRDGSYSRGRGRGGRGNLPPRMTRGRGRDRDNDYDRDRNDRNESGRGRGRRNAEMNGPSRRSNRGGGGGGGQRSFTNSKFGNFQEEDAFKSTDNVWRNPPTESWDNAVNSNTQPATKTGEWGAEEWGAEDWTGDLAESQVFTATNPVPPMPLDPISASPSSQMQAPVGQPPSSGLSNQGMPQQHSMDVQSSLTGPPGGMSAGSSLSAGGSMPAAGTMSAGGSMPASGNRQPVGGSIGQSSAGNIGQPPTGSIGQPHSSSMMQGMVGQPQGGMPGGMSTGGMPTGNMSAGGMSSGGMSAGSIGQPPGGVAVGGSVIGQGGMNSSMQGNTTMPDMTRSIDLAALFGKSVQAPSTSLGVSDPAASGRDSSSVFSQFRDPSKTQNMNSMAEQQSKQVQMGMDQSQAGQLPPSSRAPTQSKPTRKKLPPPSTKIPASAVEMPNSARGLGALDVQFGAMDITMDPAVTDFGLSSSSMPSSMSSTLSTSGGLSNSAFSVNSPGTSANHLSYSKSNESPYPASTGMSPVGMSTNTSVNTPPSSVPQQSLDPTQQRGPPHYGQNSQQKQMTPDPIPLPNQNDMKTNAYLTSQKPSSVQSIDNKDKTTSQLSQLASLSSSSGFGLSTSQSIGVNRQVPNSYGSPGISGSSSMPTTSSSQYQTSELSSGGTSAFSTPMGSSGLSGGLSSGPSTIGYSSPSQTAGSLNSGGVLSSSVVSGGSSSGGTVGVSVGSSLSSSGHLSSGMSASSSVSQATTTLSSTKLAGLDTRQGQSSLGSSNLVSATLNSVSSSSTLSSASSSVLTSSSLGYTTTTAGLAGSKSVSQGSAKLPPNLPPGMPFMYHPNLIGAGFPLVNPIPAHQPYMYEDFQMQIGRLPMPFQQLATTTLNTGRDTNSLGNTPYSVTEASKFPRNDAASPVATSLSTQQHQPTAGSALAAGQGAHHQTQTQQQAPFLNTTLPPGYPGYSTLPYYAAGPAGLMPPGLQYPAVFPAVSSVQPTNRAQTATTPHSAFQQSGYTQPASHNAYGTGYDELTQTPDFSKGGYNSVSQSQSKGSGVTGRVTASVSSASTGPADLAGSSYSSKSHTQPFDNKGGFHTGTPPPFNYPLTAVTQAGALNPAAAAGAAQQAHYPPFVPILPHHSAMLAHQLPGDTQGAGSTGRSQGGASQSSKTSKPSYGTNYWPN